MDFSEGPSLRPKHNPPTSVSEKAPGNFGVHDTLRHGFDSARNDIIQPHPLEQAQANYAVNREALMFQTLREVQGLHAPLRRQMERKITSRIQRLPPLESSMVAFDTLVGNDECLAIEDVLGTPLDTHLMVNTHAAMEKKLNMK